MHRPFNGYSNTSPLPQVLRLCWFVGTVLAFEDDGAALQDLHRMPLADGDVEGDALPFRPEVDDLRHLPRGVVEHLAEMPAEAHHRLGRLGVPMYRQRRPRLQRIQHPLTLVLWSISKVQVHP